MIVKLFQPRFAPLVRDRIKRQTVRPWPKRLPKVGEEFSGRQWSGLPYRSEQIELVRSRLLGWDHVTIKEWSVWLGERPHAQVPYDAFAKADGFKDWTDLQEWFLDNHELPFSGIVYFWE